MIGIRIGLKQTKHGNTPRGARTPEYISWSSMCQRCNNPKHRHYKDYGGRGIQVCKRWLSFNLFLEDMGKRPSINHSLDRRENDGNYCKDNCYWATKEEQSSNTRVSVKVTINSKTHTISEWCRKLNISPNVVHSRRHRGWDTTKALTTPVSTMARSKSEIGKSNSLKGKTYERRVAKLMTEWSGVEFRRRRVEGRDDLTILVDSVADIIPASAKFLFSIEVKNQKGFSMDALLANPEKCMFASWWAQACYDSYLLNKVSNDVTYPMVVFKPHTAYDWVAFSSHAANFIETKAGNGIADFAHLKFDIYNKIDQVLTDVSHSSKNPNMVQVKLDPLIICRWKDFAAHVKPEPLLKAKP